MLVLDDMKAPFMKLLALYAAIHAVTGLSLGPIPWGSVLSFVVETSFTLVLVPFAIVYMYWSMIMVTAGLVFLVSTMFRSLYHTDLLAHNLHYTACAPLLALVCYGGITLVLVAAMTAVTIQYGTLIARRIHALNLAVVEMSQQIEWLVNHRRRRIAIAARAA